MSDFTERYNIHTHSFYCGHGNGKIGEYVREGESGGLLLLGFSEHCPYPDSFLYRSRMAYEQMPVYEADVRSEGEKASIPVILGYECDYFPRYRSFFEEVKGRVDYLITGTHFIVRPDNSRVSPFSDKLEKDDLFRYRDQMLTALDTGLFDFIAHPDLFMAGYENWDGTCEQVALDIIRAAMEKGLALEINGNGMQKPRVAGRDPYPYGRFFDLAAAAGARCIVSTDAHRVSHLLATKARLEAFAKEHGVRLAHPEAKSGKLEWAD